MSQIDEVPVFHGKFEYQEWPEKLTLQQSFRLVEIAHETPHNEVRQVALQLLALSLSPPMIVNRDRS